MIADLRHLLHAHVPGDDAERQHLQRMVRLLDTPAPCARAQAEPGHFTASAFVLDPSGDALLLIHHRKLDLWLQPGGHIDPDDVSPLAAAMRELAEETGVTQVRAEPALLDVDVHPIPAHGHEPPHEHFDLRFLLRAQACGLTPAPEVKDARWVSLGHVGQTTRDASVLRVVAKLRSRTP